ncbi:MAG: nitrite/sulfite reductase, partial [Spirochaetales bacterium]|nr:nitrite/sulfite reductase [Candidatus Physcosoma equi]
MTREEELWKKDYEQFTDATRKFYAKEMDTKTYKGISGNFGSYAQRGAASNMLRLRLPGGRLTKEKFGFIVDAIEKYGIDKAHFTTCQAIQLHNLSETTVTELAPAALSVGIVTRGGGGDNPRNTMMSPLAGVEKGEYFSVVPYALAVGDFAMKFITMPKMPRKLKIAFSNTKENIPHATFRDMGFVAREDGLFDVYAAGGLGNKPLLGVLVKEAVDPKEILYYVEAMHTLFCKYGDYENRAHARTRFLQEICGGVDAFREKFLLEVEEAKKGEDLTLTPERLASSMAGVPCEKCSSGKAAKATPDDSVLSRRVIEQKQKGLYAVKYHPIGGNPDLKDFRALYETILEMDKVECRVA